MSSISELKALLVDTLANQIENGVTVVTKDGEERVVDVGAPVLAVAAKVVKDWAGEIESGASEDAKITKLSNYLAHRRGLQKSA